MMNHALETGPEECCGLIVGDARERFRHLVRCRNEMTERHNSDPRSYPRDNRTGFYMNPIEVQQVQRAAEEGGVQVTAVYHSHVGAGAYLSDLDLRHAEDELFLFPRADWIVLAVVENRIGQVALFRRAAEGFRGHPVESVLA
jgi:proteasome lid subunit RPN8/RPN11